MFEHLVLRINYTTYDVQRGFDTLHPRTGDSNIMVLARHNPFGDYTDARRPRFWYARVLGAYHVNVIYEGPGQKDWNPRRLEFLWVRWYETNNADTYGWSSATLQSVSFPSVAGAFAFAFIDPVDVVRACHVISAFDSGKRFEDGVGSSGLARNKDDWREYYVGR